MESKSQKIGVRVRRYRVVNPKNDPKGQSVIQVNYARLAEISLRDKPDTQLDSETIPANSVAYAIQ